MSQDSNPDSHHGDNPNRKANRLIDEQSPYLRQHAYNPVDWYAWGPDALERARTENKPIMLSIGYSACHWCHVMERESFENDAIARLINENFIPIKVDREERPDLDQIYMDAVQLITGRGGWPLTMFLAPDGRPFFGGTYYRAEDRQGMPGFPRILVAVSQAYRDKAKEVTNNLEKLTEALGATTNYVPTGGDLKPGLASESARALASHYDSINGGLGQAPKFPNTFVFSLLLRVHAADGDESMAEMVRHTLAKMARGGIYDQVGGGFHRYSVDERWLVPHFEKMLYDNALLARLYLHPGRPLNHPEFLALPPELFAASEQRVKPGCDEKILVAWNAMMIGAFAEGYRAIHERRYLEAAERAANFMMTTMWDGRALRRSLKDGVARHNAYLEDYAQLAGAMLDLYEASFDAKYLAHARTLADVILERFIDKEKGGFFFTSDDHEALIMRSKAAFDGSTPSGNSAAVMALLRLHGYTGEERYRVEAERTLRLFREFIEKQPFGFSHMLEAVDLYQRGPTEVVIIGDRNSPELLEWIERLGLIYVPNLAIFVADPADAQTGFIPEQVRDKRQIDGHVTAYVCREHTCTPPITSFKDLQKELAD